MTRLLGLFMVLVAGASASGATWNDAALSDDNSQSLWSVVSAAGTGSLAMDSTDKTAGNVSWKGTFVGSGDYCGLNMALPEAAQFKFSEITAFRMNFKILTAGSHPYVLFRSATNDIVASFNLAWNWIDGNYTTYWSQPLTRQDLVINNPDTVVTYIQVGANYAGDATIFIDNVYVAKLDPSVWSDAALSDSLENWGVTAAGGTPQLAADTTTKTAGNMAIKGLFPDQPYVGGYCTLNFILPQLSPLNQLTWNRLRQIGFNFQILTNDAGYGAQVLFRDANNDIIAGWSNWGASGSLIDFWSQPFTKENFTLVSGKADTTIRYISFGGPYLGGDSSCSNDGLAVNTTIYVDNLSIVCDPASVLDMNYGTGIAIDGDLTEWQDAQWIALDKNYNGTSDISEASYAVKYGNHGNTIYTAIKVKDSNHIFTDAYNDWNTRDAVEIYIHTTGKGPVGYGGTQADAQEYTIGMNNLNSSDPTRNVWTSIGYNKPVPSNAGLQAAGRVDGEWIYYEVALTPYEFFSLDGIGLRASQLHANDIIGFDVVAAGKSNTGFGMKSANLVPDKSTNYESFQLYQLGASPAIPGDANEDGKVDVSDLGILAANYGITTGGTWAKGDFNNDGKVDVSDLGILAANYGTGSAQSLDFNKDAKTLGLAGDQGDSTKEGSDNKISNSCGLTSVPVVVGILLVGFLFSGLKSKDA